MVGDFEEGSRTWGFAMNWVLSESWVNFVTACLSRVYVRRAVLGKGIAIINKVAAVSSHSSSRNRGCFIYIYIFLWAVFVFYMCLDITECCCYYFFFCLDPSWSQNGLVCC